MEMEKNSDSECTLHKDKCGVYKSCVLHDDKCGPYNHVNKAIVGIFECQNLNEDTKPHFTSLKLKDSKTFTERELIENRLGRTLLEGEKLCAYHRYTLGVGFKSKRVCQHPHHERQVIQRKSPAVRVASLAMVQYISDQYNVSFPVGSVLCFKHLKKNTNVDNTPAPDEPVQLQLQDPELQDPEYIPDEIILNEDVVAAAEDTAMEIATCLEASPVVTLKRTQLKDLNKKGTEYYNRKYKKLKRSLKEKFAEAAAPGQSEALMQLLEDSSDDEDEVVPSDLQTLVTKYRECNDASGKLVVLSLVDHKRYTHEYVSKVFDCTMHQVKKAVIVASKPWEIPKKERITRNRLDEFKYNHFLEFIFSSGMIQDVAYGVRKLKFDSGDIQEIPKTILMCKYSHCIGTYLSMCEKAAFDHLSERTLWRILNHIKPSQQKSLSGLDDIVAAGMNAFQILLKDVVKSDEALSKKLENGKRYLKTKYQLNCSTDSPVKTHNINFALSDPNNQKLRAEHKIVTNENCIDCLQLWKTLDEIQIMAENSKSPVLQYDVKTAIDDIAAYVSHLMRDVQQKKAKTFAFCQLDASTFFWLKDYCQKILPQKFREGQVDYFGKKGMSLHVDIFFTKENDILKKYIYFTCMQRADQDAMDVLATADNLLKKIQHDHPQITKMFTKSDNAGCYHNSLGPEALYWLCKSYGITLQRYDFNEPCKGKDQCDRESAAAKTILKSYLHAGNDVMTADDIFQAMHYGYGMKDTEICVAENDKSKTKLSGHKTKNFTSYHSFEFTATGMKVWRYFDVGPGVFLPYVKTSFDPTGFTVTKPFSKTEQMKRTLSKKPIRPSFCLNDTLNATLPINIGFDPTPPAAIDWNVISVPTLRQRHCIIFGK